MSERKRTMLEQEFFSGMTLSMDLSLLQILVLEIMSLVEKLFSENRLIFYKYCYIDIGQKEAGRRMGTG